MEIIISHSPNIIIHLHCHLGAYPVTLFTYGNVTQTHVLK